MLHVFRKLKKCVRERTCKKIVKYDNYDFEYLTYSSTRFVNAISGIVVLCETGLYFVVIAVLEGVALLFFVVIAVLLFYKLKNILLISDSVMLFTIFFNRI